MGENDNKGDGTFTAEELAEDIKLEEEFTSDEFDPSTATPEQVQKLIKTSQTALAQKKHWRGKATDPESGKTYSDSIHNFIKIYQKRIESLCFSRTIRDSRLSRLQLCK